MTSLEEIQKHLEKEMHRYNHQSIPDFEGYSPDEMQQILYNPMGPESPVQLQTLKDTEYVQIPLYNQTRYLAEMITRQGEVKLTQKGFLPTKMVAELYAQDLIKGTRLEQRLTKVKKETDFFPIHLSRIMLEAAGLTKKRKGKLSLTKAAAKTLSEPALFFEQIYYAYTHRYNWAYGDIYESDSTGKMGFAFSLILVSQYGKQERPVSFYTQKYFKAFPMLLEENTSHPSPFGSFHEACYSHRTFYRFMNLFGLIEIREEGSLPKNRQFIKKKSLFDKLIHCKPHKANPG